MTEEFEPADYNLAPERMQVACTSVAFEGKTETVHIYFVVAAAARIWIALAKESMAHNCTSMAMVSSNSAEAV